MADFTQIIQEINDDINTNGVGAITGAKLNDVLRDMIAAVNAEKQDKLQYYSEDTADERVDMGGTASLVAQFLENILLVSGNWTIGNYGGSENHILLSNISTGTKLELTENAVEINANGDIVFRVSSEDGVTINGESVAVVDDIPNVSGKADKVSGATNGHFAGLNASGNLTDSGKSPSDFATAAQGGKADTAVQQVTVGTTTTGNAGTNASVTNSGTVTNPVLDFTIPRGADGADGQDGADAVNPFKGWWPDLATLKAAHTATAGDSAYIKDASPATTWSIYVYDSTASSDNYWADSGLDADTSNVQTFESGEEVNEVSIVNDFITGGEGNVASAETIKNLNNMYVEVFGGEGVVTYEAIQYNCTSGVNPYTNTSNPKVSPFIDVHSYNYQIRIKKIILKCNSLGNSGSTDNFKIRCCSPTIWNKYVVSGSTQGPVVNYNDFTDLGVITLQEGMNEIDVDFVLPKNYHLVFGNNAESGALTIYYNNSDAGDGFIYFDSSTGKSRYIARNISISYVYEYSVSAYTNTKVREGINSVLLGKRLSILGDSISTFSGYIPSGNAAYYPHTGNDVNAVTDTWWKKVIDALKLELAINNSWSGSYVTTNNGDASSAVYSRCENLGEPDIIFFYMGINDFNHEVALGTYDGNSALPSTTTTFREAYAITLNKILTKYKTAKLYCFTLIAEEKNGESGFPEINGNGNTIKQFNAAIKDIADAFGVEVIDLAKCGLTYQNMSIYNTDQLHPNKAGHSIMANYVIKQMDNAIFKRY